MSAQFSLFAPGIPTIEGIDVGKALASYSADRIGEANKVRTPVSCGGDLWVYCGGRSQHGICYAEMYRLVPLAEFDGQPTTYRDKLSVVRPGDRYAGDYARDDPNGFYHGMTVTHGGVKHVLVGPPLQLVAERPKETLFADAAEEDYDVEEDYEVESDDPYPCVRCGIDLSQLDEYEELEEGAVCPECAALAAAV